MRIKFTALGEPQGKGRPIFSTYGGRVSARTPEKTVEYENRIMAVYRRANPGTKFPDGAMLDLRVVAFYGIPASASNKLRMAMLAGEVRPTKKPDADNILKAVADSLNGLAYRDDAQIVDTQVRKFYSAQPRIEVTIQETGGVSYEQMQL